MNSQKQATRGEPVPTCFSLCKGPQKKGKGLSVLPVKSKSRKGHLRNRDKMLSTVIGSVNLGHTESVLDSPGEHSKLRVSLTMLKVYNMMSLKSLPIELRGNLRHPYYVKPDTNPEERAVESQRWSLITSGMDRKNIHISKNRIYISPNHIITN